MDSLSGVFTAENMTLLVLLVAAVTIHELCHGLVAYALGDPTGKEAGRLTLNPLVHLDLWMSFLMPLALMIARQGNMWFAGAKPMPVQTDYLRSPRRDLALVAAAGPLSNWLLALLTVLIFKIMRTVGVLEEQSFAGGIAVRFIQLNLFLVVLNLLPIPPLDGYKIGRILLPRALAQKLDGLEFVGIILVLLLLMTQTGSQWMMDASKALLPTVMWLRRLFM